MKLLKILLLLATLCKTIDADNANVEKVSFSVEKIWKSYRTHRTCSPEDGPWKKGVQAFYDGCRKAANSFRGKAFVVGDTTVESLRQLITKSIDLSYANATILSSSAVSILNTLSLGDKLNRSSMNIIVEYVKIFSKMVAQFNETAKKLCAHIGDLIWPFINAVSEFGNELSKFMREFIASCRLFQCKKSVDFKCVLKKHRCLSDIIALIDRTLLNECDGKVSREVYDSVLVLHLIYCYMGISLTGINSCVLDVQYERKCYVSEIVKSCSQSFEYALVETLQAVSAVVVTSIESFKLLLTIVVNIVSFLDKAVEGVLGLTSNMLITVGDIVKHLVKG